jgi:hypothetical protein
MTLVRLERNPHEYADPESVAFWFHSSPPSVDTNAHIRIAIHAIGTIVLLAINNQRRLFGCMQRNGTWINQNKKKAIMVLVSMPWLVGMVFFSVKKLGQMAAIMHLTALAPFIFWIANQKMARIAREMMAT